MIAKTLVEKGMAVRNPNYNSDAKLGSDEVHPIHIPDSDRIISFDESRIELDMNRADEGKGVANRG